MNTYRGEDGQLHDKYRAGRGQKFDGPGKLAARLFWEQRGWVVSDFDIGSDGVHQWKRTDLLMTKADKVMYIEAEIKAHEIWHHVYQGVDVTSRKKKYCEYISSGCSAWVMMFQGAGRCDEHGKAVVGNNLLFIPMECLQAAEEDCGTEYKGHGKVLTTAGFVMPEHECHRVRKWCYNEGEWTKNDFYRIPLQYCVQYARASENDPWRLQSRRREFIRERSSATANQGDQT